MGGVDLSGVWSVAGKIRSRTNARRVPGAKAPTLVAEAVSPRESKRELNALLLRSRPCYLMMVMQWLAGQFGPGLACGIAS